MHFSSCSETTFLRRYCKACCSIARKKFMTHDCYCNSTIPISML
uniref:Uncharacterized protein n=1 Tax=Rhizophora mucronata TaxID=61149 RepID=A0A2P2QE56_RHIMU